MPRRFLKTPAGKETWAFICGIVCPSLPYGSSRTDIRFAAYRAFRCGKDFPQSRVDEAAQERNGWTTYHRFRERAIQLGIQPGLQRLDALPSTHSLKVNRVEAARNDAEFIDRLEWMRRNATGIDYDALTEAINQMRGYSHGGVAVRHQAEHAGAVSGAYPGGISSGVHGNGGSRR